MPPLVPATKTPLSRVDAVALIRRQFERLTGSGPSRETLAILAGQSSFETNAWQSMYNWNFGFVTVLPTSKSPAFVLPNDELPGQAEHYYQSYATPEDGCIDWLARLQKKWPGAWASALEGDYEGFHASLLSPTYHTTGYNFATRSWDEPTKYQERARPHYNSILTFLGGEVQDNRPLARPVPPPLPSSWVPRLSGASLLRAATLGNLDVLRFGTRGADVAFVQFMVKAPLTGLYDSFTEQAVKDFQSRRGLKVDGIWGHECWKAAKA